MSKEKTAENVIQKYIKLSSTNKSIVNAYIQGVLSQQELNKSRTTGHKK